MGKGLIKPFLNAGQRRQIAKASPPPLVMGTDLRDAKEERFVRMVCDGLSLGDAFARAGFQSTHNDAAHKLFHLDRIQQRAAVILEQRATVGAVTLADVTSMLQRVFSGAHAAEEFSAAHNAAFSLARIYGHVTDRATLEVIRRPSRDPDAPSEQALSSWVEGLPSTPALGPGAPAFGPVAGPEQAAKAASELRAFSAPAPLLGPGPGLDATKPEKLNGPNGLDRSGPSGPSEARASLSKLPNEINWLQASGPRGSGPDGSQIPIDGIPIPSDGIGIPIDGIGAPMATPGRPENGAPSRPVTETSNT